MLILLFLGCSPKISTFSNDRFEKVGLEFKVLPHGNFEMGCDDKDCRENEAPVHKVTISSFMIANKEVSQELWEQVTGSNPSDSPARLMPVNNISFKDTILFLNTLSQQEGLEPSYTVLEDSIIWNREATGYRLPTEAEWEYAAKAGSNNIFAGSNNHEDVAWTKENAHNRVHLPSQLAPNNWGLYDMSGNLHEWVWDFKADYPSESTTDPQGPTNGELRIHRGGAWDFGPDYARVTYRNAAPPDFVSRDLGFRLAKNN